MRTNHSICIVLWAALLASAAHAQAGARDAKKLPPAPAPEARDWLVHTITRRAGVFRGETDRELILDNGLVRRVFLLTPNAATVAIDSLTTGESFVRAIRPEGEVSFGGKNYKIGGLSGQPVQNYISRDGYDSLTTDADSYQFRAFEFAPIRARLDWGGRKKWTESNAAWPPPGIELILHFDPPAGAPKVNVEVHYELYDGLPLLCKWIECRNESGEPVRIDTFKSEIIAFVEASSDVEENPRAKLPNVYIETNFTKASMTGEAASRDTVYWKDDPSYTSQVNYQLKTPCLLECRPPLGPNLEILPRASFATFRTWMLPFDSNDKDRKILSLTKMYRTLAPWTAQNPLLFHVRSADPAAVRAAVDQAADVGFELIIMTFGSGFDIESTNPDYIKQIKELADYAHSKGVGLGGYSLLASRSVGERDDVINPKTGKPGGFAIFDNSPCLASEWGKNYFLKLTKFFEATGCDVLEHDGSYPGDACASKEHPGHKDYEDSRWVQWSVITNFYNYCRGKDIYLNVPDWYFLNGSNKTGMGYRETNWSLPRDYQEIIERQNIYDGTRYKTPTMGWMFVPLTEYHGGGAAATIEPLDRHLDHYERRLMNLLGAGVQACFRGPRLYDTERTRSVVKKWVDFYKKHREILDSDLIGLRRADGRDYDGWLHVNPNAKERGLAMIYNPLSEDITRTIQLPLYYTGLEGAAMISVNGGEERRIATSAGNSIQNSIKLDIKVPAKGASWVIIKEAPSNK
ncbi:MAG: alpha-galactosidase [Planctomycetota bacterium]